MNVNPLQARTPAGRRVVAGAGAAALCFGLTGGLLAAMPAANAAGAVTIKDVVLGVGSDETQRYVTWYADASTESVVKLEKTADLAGGAFDEDAVDYPATLLATTGTSAGDVARSPYRGSTLLDTLEENTPYSYQVLASDGSVSPTYTFKSGSFGLGDGFTFAAFGDPQIGAESTGATLSTSAEMQEDAAGWVDTLNVLQADAADDALPLELLTSTGDQIETANAEAQWDAWFQAEQLRSFPYAAAIGNHDSSDLGYKYHFALPNNDVTTPDLQTAAGGDYWYTYKDVLFVVINSNAQSATKNPAHMDFVTKAVKANPTAKWRVVSYHHAIYSPASHANDSDAVGRRPAYTQGLSELGINLVLQGHDHSYSRSYVVENDGSGADRQNPAEAQGANNVVSGPGGVIYVTTNSASGSKYYGLSEPRVGTSSDATHGGKYPVSTMPWGPAGANADNGTPAGTHGLHWANSVENQDNVRTYLKVAVTEDKLTVANVVAGVCDYPNKATTSHRENVCGAEQSTTVQQENGTWATTTGVDPVGTAQDSVHITKWDGSQGDGQLVALDVPNTPAGSIGVVINNGTNRLINLGSAVRNGSFYAASGRLDSLTVSDTRTSPSNGWTLSAQMSNFKDANATLHAKYFGWSPALVAAGGGAVEGGAVATGYDGGTGLSESRILARAVNGHPIGAAEVAAQLNAKFPASSMSGEAHNFWGEITYTLL